MTKRILLVDDEVEITEINKRYLTQAGYEVNDTLPAMASVLVAFENQRNSPPTTGIEQNTQPWLLAAGIAAAAGTTWFLVHQIFRGKRRKESRDSHGR